MTVEPLLSHSTIALQRVLRVAGFTLVAVMLIIAFRASDRSARNHWLRKATTAQLEAEAANNPDDEELNLVLNHHLLDDGESEQAYNLMVRVTRQHPDSARSWDAFAGAASASSRVIETLKGYQREAELNPKATTALATIGTIYLKAGLLSDGLAKIDSVRRIQPNVPIDAPIWVSALRAHGRDQDAWQAIIDALGRDPQQDTLYGPLGELAVKLNRYDEAEMLLLKRIQMSPKYFNPLPRAALARLLVTKSKDKDTLEAAVEETRLGAQEETATAQAPYAEMLLRSGDRKHAKAVLENALRMDNHEKECLRMLAGIADAEGRTADAQRLRANMPPRFEPSPELAALKTAAHAAPLSSAVQLAYAGALERAGQFGEAADVCAAQLALNSADVSAAQMLTRCRDEALRKLDTTERAAADARRLQMSNTGKNAS